MKSVSVPWKAWYGDEVCDLTFPDSWDIALYPMTNAPQVSEREIRQAFGSPIGCPPLEVIAKGKKSAAIAVDDISRPTPAGQLLPYVLEYLEKGGVKKEQVTIVVALGSHAPLSKNDLVHKLGRDVLQHYSVVQHHPSLSVEDIGFQLDGIPVRINKDFLQAELKISMGGITPHPFAGFSGGGKLILPGLANMEIIERTHRYVVMGLRGGFAVVEGNQFRDEVERVCRKCRIDLIVDVVVNQTRGIAGVFVGDVRQAFLKGVDFARRVYHTPIPVDLDVVVLNAYPKDTDLVQSENALNVLRSTKRAFLKEQGKIVLMTASSHGVGTHGLFAPGGRLYHRPLRKRWLRGKELIVYAPGVSEDDMRSLFWSGYVFCQTWDEVLRELQKAAVYPHCRVGVFPCSSLQLGEIA